MAEGMDDFQEPQSGPFPTSRLQDPKLTPKLGYYLDEAWYNVAGDGFKPPVIAIQVIGGSLPSWATACSSYGTTPDAEILIAQAIG